MVRGGRAQTGCILLRSLDDRAANLEKEERKKSKMPNSPLEDVDAVATRLC